MGAPCAPTAEAQRMFWVVLDLQKRVSTGHAGWVQGQLGREVTEKEGAQPRAAAASLVAMVLRRCWVKGAQLGEPPEGLCVLAM